jgi:flagellar protein FliO/FliZ
MMDTSFIVEFIKMIVLLPLILLLIYISLKHGGKYISNLTSGRIIKVYERVPLGQNTQLSVVSIGGKPYVIISGEKGAQILLELDEEILKNYQMNQGSNSELVKLDLARYIEKIKGKVKNEKA